MNSIRRLAILAVLLAPFLAAPAARAVEGAGGHRASALIFPFFDSRSGWRTFLRVTQAAPTSALGTDSLALHNFYVETFSDPFEGTLCREFDRFRPITLNDAEVWDIRSEYPNATRGFAISYLVSRATIGGIITFRGQLGWDTLFGESVVLNLTDGWIVAVQSIPIRFDPSAAQPVLGGGDTQSVIAEAEGPSFGGPDGNAVNYEFSTFGNEFDMHFFNPNIRVEGTDYVILPFSLTELASLVWVQPREAFDGETNRFAWFGDWWDHDENQHNLPAGVVRCWGIRSLDDLTLGGALSASAGYGWIRLRGFDSFYAPGGETAVIFQIEDPVPNAGLGWGFYPARRANNLELVSDGPFTTPGAFPFQDPEGSNDGKTSVERF